MFKYSLFSFLSGAVSFPPPPYWPRFESPTLAAATLYETYNIPIVKKYNQFIVSEHKLYGFLQSVLTAPELMIMNT